MPTMPTTPLAHGPLPPLRRLEAFERSTKDRPIYQLPEGSVDLSAPPAGLDVDTAELARLRAARRAKAYASRHRGKLLRAREGGNGNKGFLIPQSARLRESQARARRFQQTRKIKQEKTEAIEAMRKKARLASKFQGEPNADARSTTGGLPLAALRRPEKFAPGSSHLQSARRVAKVGRWNFEQSFQQSTLEQDLFDKANRLQAEFAREWTCFTGPRAQQLQKVARTHLVRRALEAYGERVEECRRLVQTFVQERELRWMRIVFKAFARIATKRLYFRMLLVRSRRILAENRACKCFEAWKQEARLPARREWRQRYYHLMLHGSSGSRMSRMRMNFEAWRMAARALAFLGQILGRHAQRSLRQWVRGRHVLRAENVGTVSALQAWWRSRLAVWEAGENARSLVAMLKSRRLMDALAQERRREAMARIIQREWRLYGCRCAAARWRAQRDIARVWRGTHHRAVAARWRRLRPYMDAIRRRAAARCIADAWTAGRLRRNPMDVVVLEAHQERLELEFEGWFWAQALEVESWLAAEEEEEEEMPVGVGGGGESGSDSGGGGKSGRGRGKIGKSSIKKDIRATKSASKRATKGSAKSASPTHAGRKSSRRKSRERSAASPPRAPAVVVVSEKTAPLTLTSRKKGAAEDDGPNISPQLQWEVEFWKQIITQTRKK